VITEKKLAFFYFFSIRKTDDIQFPRKKMIGAGLNDRDPNYSRGTDESRVSGGDLLKISTYSWRGLGQEKKSFPPDLRRSRTTSQINPRDK
jgi:hypothetical protein